VRQEPFPVRHYEYGEVVLTAAGEPIEAVSLHGLSGRRRSSPRWTTPTSGASRGCRGRGSRGLAC